MKIIIYGNVRKNLVKEVRDHMLYDLLAIKENFGLKIFVETVGKDEHCSVRMVGLLKVV